MVLNSSLIIVGGEGEGFPTPNNQAHGTVVRKKGHPTRIFRALLFGRGPQIIWAPPSILNLFIYDAAATI